MKELFDAAFSAMNIIPTTILMFAVGYWLLVIIGALDISTFDFDIDIDADVDLDLDADFDVDGNPDFDADSEMDATGQASVAWINEILRFLNIDKIPLMVFVTFWAIPMWIMSVVINDFFGNTSFILSLGFLVPNLIVSLIIAKPLTFPFVKMFKLINTDEERSQVLLGAVGKVIIRASDKKMGQGEVLIEGSNYRLNIRTRNGEIEKGQGMLVVNYLEEKKYYIVEPYETIE